jgi:hypothetical protein
MTWGGAHTTTFTRRQPCFEQAFLMCVTSALGPLTAFEVEAARCAFVVVFAA